MRSSGPWIDRMVIVWVFAMTLFTSRALAEGDATTVRPYTIAIDEQVIVDLKLRLTRTRLPEDPPVGGWEYGVDPGYLRDLIDHWRTSYDWRSEERRLNAFDQYITEIDGLDIHFIHQRSKEPNARPLVIVHGWPGSFVESVKVIGPLTDPVAYGGRAEDAFHVVVPSLPGFGFSAKPREPGWSVSRMAGVIARLMQRLGYERYGAQGGDWGAGVANWLATYDAPHVIGAHINFPAGSPPMTGDPWEGVTPAERERHERRQQELQNHRAYGAIQGTRPQTIGIALNDSPAGLAAWIVDKFWAWSDHGGNLDNSFTKDELLTNVMIYWVTQTPASAARIYFERQQFTGDRQAGSAPVGCALFPKEINVPPRKWVEARYNLVHWTEMPRGGHFAAMETPDLLVEDVRKFFGNLPQR
jgi:epoxide hydrolase